MSAEALCRARKSPELIAAYVFLFVGALLFMVGYYLTFFSLPFLLVGSVVCATEWWRHRRHAGCEVAQLAAIGAGMGAFVLSLAIGLLAPSWRR